MRRIFIIGALAVTVFLHVYTGTKSPGIPHQQGQIKIVSEMSGSAPVLAHLNACQKGDRVTVVGRISAIWEPTGKRAPHTVILRDESGVLEIVHWLQHPPRVAVGDRVQCAGTVDLYRGTVQLRLWTPEDLQVLNP